MRAFTHLVALAITIAPAALQAGDGKSVLTVPEVSPPPYELTVAAPMWLPWLVGDIGVGGVTTDVYAGVDEILKNLDMIAALQGEFRHDRWGVLFDGLYNKTSFSGEPDSLLISNAQVGMKQSILEGAIAYRVYENDRAWVDVLAGARWMYLGNSLQLTADDDGVSQAASELSSRFFGRATSAVRREVEDRLPELLNDFSSTLSAEVEDRAAASVGSSDQGLSDRINQAFRRRTILPGEGPDLGRDIAYSSPVRSAVKEYAKAAAAARIEEKRAQISSAVATARASIRAEADRRLSEAEQKLEETIESQLQESIPESELSASKSWVDPFVGLRARCQLAEQWYAIGRADIGGFGVSSDIAWNLYGALGYQFRPNMTAEVGYRHYVVDYTDGGFIYDVAQTGPVMSFGITF